VDPTQISVNLDGSYHLTDHLERQAFTWTSLSALATDWLSEWRAGESGPAGDFVHAACDGGVPGVVDVLVALAEMADRNADESGWVGAGPIEDLLLYSDHGLRVVDEVAGAAKQRPAFRAALDFAILPHEIGVRLAKLGVQARLLKPLASGEEPPEPDDQA